MVIYPFAESKADLSRFFRKVDRSEGCWIWKGNVAETGYGRFFFTTNGTKRTGFAHRCSFLWARGYLPPVGLVIDHMCGVRRCVNPAHLRVLTITENARLGRAPSAAQINEEKTRCPQGHPYDEENTYAYHGGRQCRRCRVEHDERYRATHRALIAAKARDRRRRAKEAARG